jgi:TolB-like protein
MLKKTDQEKNPKLLGAFLLTLILLVSACANDTVVKDRPPMPFEVKKILIFPFEDMAGVYGQKVDARCPVCGKVFMTGQVTESATRILTDQVFILLKKQRDIELIPASQARGVMSGLRAGSKNTLSEQDLWIETGRDLGADAVIVGHLYRFRERIGTQYSVEVPASVAFDIHLIGVRDGRLLWSGKFDETQQSLFEDLYQLGTFLSRRGRWITAQELAVSGLEGVLETFPASAKGLKNQ